MKFKYTCQVPDRVIASQRTLLKEMMVPYYSGLYMYHVAFMALHIYP